MLKKEKKITKTQRILGVYYLLSNYEEVSFKELTDSLPGWCEKTFTRDISLLKKAGIPVKFSLKLKAYVLEFQERAKPRLSKNKAEVRYIKKIMRLTRMMDEMPGEDCDKWYEDAFPDVSKRTMQRDFATLNAVGYRIKYERESYNYHDSGIDLPPGHYYFDSPYGEELEIFRRF